MRHCRSPCWKNPRPRKSADSRPLTLRKSSPSSRKSSITPTFTRYAYDPGTVPMIDWISMLSECLVYLLAFGRFVGDLNLRTEFAPAKGSPASPPRYAFALHLYVLGNTLMVGHLNMLPEKQSPHAHIRVKGKQKRKKGPYLKSEKLRTRQHPHFPCKRGKRPIP
ncbi:DNA replication and repair protein RecF [Striga asiatica]|uniref:DNA replication and repair protein RecF n=1 Tax=Striga asiatica TaxID=4170 RepID=A0A5A7QUF1_STRAF|nr:DNA replication and repair protein RecF [Striga asiatica]